MVSVGPGVTEVAVGDRVAYAMHTGSYAEQQAVPSWLLVKIPDNMDFPTGAATLLQAMTAHFLVHDIMPLHSGDRALVHAGAGGMGSAGHPDAQTPGGARLHHRFYWREG